MSRRRYDMNEAIQIRKRWPIFGILSIAFPLFGVPLAFLLGVAANRSVFQDPDNPEVWLGVGIFVQLSILAVLSGFISGIVALFRVERLKVLPLLALLTNSGLAILWLHLFAPPNWRI